MKELLMTENTVQINEEVKDILGELSQGFWYAGWLNDIDYAVFDLLMKPSDYFSIPMSITAKDAKKLLGRLVRLTLLDGWWPCIDYTKDKFFRVPVERIKSKKNISDADYERMLAYWDRY
jgi:hypothetical protein